jgi:hypothetical protein
MIASHATGSCYSDWSSSWLADVRDEEGAPQRVISA